MPLLLALATGSNASRIIFQRGADSSGMQPAEYFFVSLPLSAAAIRGAIAGLVRTSAKPKPSTNLVFSAFCEVGLPLYGVLRSSRQVLTDGILYAGGKRPPASELGAGGRRGDNHALHDHLPHPRGEGKRAGKERQPRSDRPVDNGRSRAGGRLLRRRRWCEGRAHRRRHARSVPDPPLGGTPHARVGGGIEVDPVMMLEDLGKASAEFERVAQKYG